MLLTLQENGYRKVTLENWINFIKDFFDLKDYSYELNRLNQFPLSIHYENRDKADNNFYLGEKGKLIMKKNICCSETPPDIKQILSYFWINGLLPRGNYLFYNE